MAGETFGELGVRFLEAREAAGWQQNALAAAAQIPRLRLLRIEQNKRKPTLEETLRIATALKIPVEVLTRGKFRASRTLRGIAFELFHLGIRDLVVADPIVPGAFRPSEQVLVLALKGDRPEPRIVESIPFLLSRNHFDVPLTLAFARLFDRRVRTRLAWLSDIALALAKLGSRKSEPQSDIHLDKFIRAAKCKSETDSLGRPAEGRLSPIWRRWNISYAGDLQAFAARTRELEDAGSHGQRLHPNGGE